MALNLTGGLGIGGAGGGVVRSERKIKRVEEAAKKVEALPGSFRERHEKERERFVDATDSEYWVCLCFDTREQKEEFLKKLGLFEHGDKYLRGDFVAEKLGVKLDSCRAKFGKPKVVSPRIRKMVSGGDDA
jgi:hypothetical protein